eukprot:6199079-Pleurochrysis_carterae.AAC.1
MQCCLWFALLAACAFVADVAACGEDWLKLLAAPPLTPSFASLAEAVCRDSTAVGLWRRVPPMLLPPWEWFEQASRVCAAHGAAGREASAHAWAASSGAPGGVAAHGSSAAAGPVVASATRGVAAPALDPCGACEADARAQTALFFETHARGTQSECVCATTAECGALAVETAAPLLDGIGHIFISAIREWVMQAVRGVLSTAPPSVFGVSRFALASVSLPHVPTRRTHLYCHERSHKLHADARAFRGGDALVAQTLACFAMPPPDE